MIARIVATEPILIVCELTTLGTQLEYSQFAFTNTTRINLVFVRQEP